MNVFAREVTFYSANHDFLREITRGLIHLDIIVKLKKNLNLTLFFAILSMSIIIFVWLFQTLAA